MGKDPALRVGERSYSSVLAVFLLTIGSMQRKRWWCWRRYKPCDSNTLRVAVTYALAIFASNVRESRMICIWLDHWCCWHWCCWHFLWCLCCGVSVVSHEVSSANNCLNQSRLLWCLCCGPVVPCTSLVSLLLIAWGIRPAHKITPSESV
jgi:hypothetical protein